MPTVRFPNETDAYRKRRDDLLEAEQALKEQRERVAQQRRDLPLGGLVSQDYVFREGPADIADADPRHISEVRLSALFAAGKDRLLIYHLMFEPDEDMGCPMCSMWVDGFNAIVPHLADRINFAVIAKADIGKLRAWGRRRGWGKLRLLSSYENTFNRDFNVETEEGQLPAASVFRREEGDKIYHSYTTEGSLEYRHHRALDLLSPVWNLFDLLPEGRGDWMPKHTDQ